MTNSIRQAFEHPPHHYPRRNIGDFISVLVFTVPMPVLQGMTLPPGGGDPFRIKWFHEVDVELKDFCMKNLVQRQLPNHSYDLVFGPACLPIGVGSEIMFQMGRFLPLQIACCTQRAWEWMASTISTNYVEKRHI